MVITCATILILGKQFNCIYSYKMIMKNHTKLFQLTFKIVFRKRDINFSKKIFTGTGVQLEEGDGGGS